MGQGGVVAVDDDDDDDDHIKRAFKTPRPIAKEAKKKKTKVGEKARARKH
jgi:hypothetical protein